MNIIFKNFYSLTTFEKNNNKFRILYSDLISFHPNNKAF